MTSPITDPVTRDLFKTNSYRRMAPRREEAMRKARAILDALLKAANPTHPKD
jgi:hypothetical protein